jgi:hypothetical protein
MNQAPNDVEYVRALRESIKRIYLWTVAPFAVLLAGIALWRSHGLGVNGTALGVTCITAIYIAGAPLATIVRFSDAASRRRETSRPANTANPSEPAGRQPALLWLAALGSAVVLGLTVWVTVDLWNGGAATLLQALILGIALLVLVSSLAASRVQAGLRARGGRHTGP